MSQLPDATRRLRPAILSLLLLLIASAGPAGRARAADVPGYSDIAKIGPNSFVVVNDRKRSAGKAYRLGIVTATKHDGMLFQPVWIRHWPEHFDPPSDLESCCVVPGSTLTILAAESGTWNHIAGRVFHLSLARNADGLWEATFLRSFEILQQGSFARPLDAEGRTYDGYQVEGMALVTRGNTLFLIYAERGGEVEGGRHHNAALVWGTLDLAAYHFTPQAEAPLVGASVLGDRDCSALYLVADKDRYRVMSVATTDPPGSDMGPFTSVVFQAGTLEINPAGDNLVYTPAPDEAAQHRITIASLKVEGLTAPADDIPGSTFMLATDDEDYGGIARPVVAPEGH